MPLAGYYQYIRSIIRRELERARQYGLPVPVVLAADGSPCSCTWYGATYDIAEVLWIWQVMDRWREAHTPYAARGFTDQLYSRVRCPDEQLFDLYFDQAQNVWMLDVAHD
jgi:hypothetical protein